MSLIKSISGIRGTIGGQSGLNLTPQDIVACTAGFGMWLMKSGQPKLVVVGRDGRKSGFVVSQLAINTLLAMGIDVIDLDFSTTPTVEMFVPYMNAGAGIIFTASHNPKEWNALKFLNHKGEFISAADGLEVLQFIDTNQLTFADVDDFGKYSKANDAGKYHINKILHLPYVDREAIALAGIRVVVDCINSTGAIFIPPLLDALGCDYVLINDTVDGEFAHNPEPLPLHLKQLSDAVIENKFDMGISVDPDVDRLAFVCEDGTMFGEEYTLVAVADYILSIKGSGNTVSNLSSTRALSDVTSRYGGQYQASAVGEVNVVNLMKSSDAIIGGEGNGGVILPELHYGRDALAGIAIFLTAYAKKGISLSSWRDSFPKYVMIKDKISVEGVDIQKLFDMLRSAFSKERINEVDGLKIDFENGWVHMRLSNTEPIIRIYAESTNTESANELVTKVKAALSL